MARSSTRPAATRSSAPGDASAHALTRLLTPRLEAVLLAVVTLVGLGLRLHDSGIAPALVDNADELQFAWAGLNLIAHGDAISWSYFPAYPSAGVLHAYGQTYPLV